MHRFRTPSVFAALALIAATAPAAVLANDIRGQTPLTIEDLRTYCPGLGFGAPSASANLETSALATARTIQDVRVLCAQLLEITRLEAQRNAVAASLGRAFAVADSDGNGELSSDEINHLPLALRFAAIDQDNDGHVRFGDLQTNTQARIETDGAASLAEALGLESTPGVEELIRDLSEVGNIQSQAARGVDANGYGVVSINLRNLGTGRTLLTFNGTRLGDDPSSTGGGVSVTGGADQNANAVPMEVLRQVDILKDGGGATYGVDAVGGVVNFVPRRLPDPTLGPSAETYPDALPNPIRQAAREPVSTFSIDVDTAAYSNVRRFLREGQRPPVEAVRVEELINYFDYGYERPASGDEPFRPFVAVAPSPWAPGKQLLHIGVQGYLPAAAERPPLNLVFLVDTSGSMSSADRLPLAKQTLNLLIDQLGPRDRVSMVAYAGSAGVVLKPTAGDNTLRMRLAVETLHSGGSTAGGAGLSLAYALARENLDPDAVNRVVLMTDGDFNVGVTNNKTLEEYISEQRGSGVYLSVYGFGRGNYQDQRMQVLAQNGNGTAAYIDSLDEARRLLRDDFEASMFPIADDVKIQVEFNPAVVAEYRLIGYETRMLRREDFNNDAVDAGEVGAGVSVTALYEITPVGGPVAIDALRYEANPLPPEVIAGDELAFLKIRYKLPGQETSRLMTRPIGPDAVYGTIDAAPEATRWASAVAAYGQKLRRDDYVSNNFSWDDALGLAQGARGTDEFGLRAEFIQLVRAARELSQQNAGL